MEKEISIYHRLLKYPPFAVKTQQGTMKIVHQMRNGGKVEALAPQSVTTLDAEKLYIAILNGKFWKRLKVGHSDVILLCVFIYDLAKRTKNNDYYSIIRSLERISTMTISYSGNGIRETTHLLHRVYYDKRTGYVEMLVDYKFYVYCKEKGLKLNIEKYTLLDPITKNLYCYIISNSGSRFREETLINRINIRSSRKDGDQFKLRKSLQELKDKHIIKDFSIQKKQKERFVIIERFRKHFRSRCENKQDNL